MYEWENGVVYLISTGKSPLNSYLLDTSENGDDVFFATAEGLVPGDIDGGYDIYDARIPHAGEPFPPAAVPCEGSVCQGPPNVPSPLAPPAQRDVLRPRQPSACGNSAVPASESHDKDCEMQKELREEEGQVRKGQSKKKTSKKRPATEGKVRITARASIEWYAAHVTPRCPAGFVALRWWRFLRPGRNGWPAMEDPLGRQSN